MQSSVLKSLPPETLNQRTLAHHPLTTILPTLTVKLKDSDHKEAVIINREDFNGAIHEVVDPKQAAEEALEALGADDPDGTPAKEFKVYKSFSYLGSFFEKNGTVKLNYKAARTISEKFRCIWPVSKEEEVNQDSVLRDELVRGLGGAVEERDPANANATGV